MTSTQFIYWFQGSLELGLTNEFSKEQVEVAQRHLDIVYKVEQEPHSPFIYWLQGIIDTHTDGLGKDVTDKIKKRIYDEFEHVINPTIGDEETVKEIKELHTDPEDTKMLYAEIEDLLTVKFDKDKKFDETGEHRLDFLKKKVSKKKFEEIQTEVLKESIKGMVYEPTTPKPGFREHPSTMKFC